MNRPVTPTMMALLGVAAVIFIVVAGANLFGMVKGYEPGSEGGAPIKVVTEVVTPTPPADAIAPATFEACVEDGYIGIGVNPEASDPRIDFLVASAADADEAGRETWCASLDGVSASNGYTPPSGYNVRQLNEWRDAINNTEPYDIQWFTSSATGGGSNRITYGVRTEFDKTLLALKPAALGVPADALVVEVWENGGLKNPPVKENSEYGVQLGLAYDWGGNLDEGVNFSVGLSSYGTEPVTIDHGTDSATEVFVFTEDGRQVWRSGSPVIAEPGRESTVRPGRPVTFDKKKWLLVNDDGYSVPEGRYLARGCAEFSYDRDLTDGALVKEKLCSDAIVLTLIVRE